MKKLLALLLVLSLVFVMTACNSKDAFLKKYEKLVDQFNEAVEDGDEDKIEKINEQLEDLLEKNEDNLEEWMEDEEFAEEYLEISFSGLGAALSAGY